MNVDESLICSMIRQICVEPVNWPAASGAISCTHVLDFGPGKSSGVGALMHKNVEGSGVKVSILLLSMNFVTICRLY